MAVSLAALGAVGAAAAAAAAPPTPPTLLLHLSDLHFASPPRPGAGDPGADLGALGSVLRHAHPSALLITGDLTHAKSANGASRQAQAEWRAYRRAVNALAAGLGWADPAVSAAATLDLRGNHDAFAVPVRAGAADEFPAWSAEGRRGAAARVAGAAVVGGRVVRAGADDGYGSACPSALLLGVDATPSPGPAGANNFAGWVGDDASLHDAILGAAAALRADHAGVCGGVEPPLVAYGHYPLATVARPLPRHHAARHSAGRARPPSLADSLTAARASLYVAGHLHAVFGDRLHRLVNGTLAEVVAAAWATERAVRLVSLDGGRVAFADFRLAGGPAPPTHAPELASSTLSLVGVSAGVDGLPRGGAPVVGSHALLVTAPADARYFRAAPATAAAPPLIRALAVPVCGTPDPEAGCAGGPPAGGLVARVTCREGGAGAPALPPVRLDRPDPAGAPHLWQGAWPPSPGCDAAVLVVESSDGASASPAVVVALSPSSRRPPLTTTRLASWAVSSDWQAVARSAFYGLWAAHFCVALLLPRMLGGSDAAAALEAAAGRGPLRALTRWLAWPAVALADNAASTGPWLAQAVFALFLLVGPWGVVAPFGGAPAGDDDGPGRLALYGPSGFTFFERGGGGPAASLYVPDAVRVGALHLIGAVAPCTAWMAASASAWARAARARSTTPSALSSAGLAAGGAAALASSVAFTYRFPWQLGGWPGVLACPGLTWTWALAAGVVVGREMVGRRAAAGGGGGAGPTRRRRKNE